MTSYRTVIPQNVSSDAREKLFMTLRARAALKGWQLLRTDDPTLYVGCRWGRARPIRGLDELGRFIDQLDGGGRAG